MQRTLNIVTAAVIVWLLLCIVYGAAFVWLYPMHEEASVLHYLAWMIDTQGAVPYRDVFETAFPGSLLFHLGIGHWLGYDDNAFRIADYLWLATLMLVTWAILQHADRRIALLVPLAFASFYFKASAGMTLQRDAVLVLPLAGALLIALQTHWPQQRTALLCGLLFGLASSSKPHALIGLPAVLWLLLWPAGHGKPTRQMIARVCIWGAAGLLAGFGLPLLWLWQRGGLAAFVDMLQHYMPLYADMGSLIDTRQPWPERLLAYVGITLAFAQGKWLVLLPAAWLTCRHALPANTRQRQLFVALLALALLYFVYVFVAHKFYNYHWMPFRYFALLASSALLVPPPTLASARQRWRYTARLLLFAVLIADFACPAPADMRDNLRAWQQHGYQKQGAGGDHLAALILQHTQPGERVQALDTGGTAMRALLLSQTVLATPIATYLHLFHHIDTPVIKRMRAEFLRKLQDNPPVLIIDTQTTDMSDCQLQAECHFDAFSQWLSAHYHVLTETCHEGHCILRLYGRNPS